MISKGYNLRNTEWEKIFYIKNGYLIIYETILTFHKHEKQNLYLINKNCPHLINRHIDISKSLKEYKKKYEYELFMKESRKYIGAHRDADFKKSFNVILSYKTKNNTKAISDFSNFLYEAMLLAYDVAHFDGL